MTQVIINASEILATCGGDLEKACAAIRELRIAAEVPLQSLLDKARASRISSLTDQERMVRKARRAVGHAKRVVEQKTAKAVKAEKRQAAHEKRMAEQQAAKARRAERRAEVAAAKPAPKKKTGSVGEIISSYEDEVDRLAKTVPGKLSESGLRGSIKHYVLDAVSLKRVLPRRRPTGWLAPPATSYDAVKEKARILLGDQTPTVGGNVKVVEFLTHMQHVARGLVFAERHAVDCLNAKWGLSERPHKARAGNPRRGKDRGIAVTTAEADLMTNQPQRPSSRERIRAPRAR